MAMTQRTEREMAGAGYIISFFSDIEILIGNAANYINNIAKMKIKYQGIDDKTIFSQEDAVMLNIIDNIKTSVYRTYVKFMSLRGKVKEFGNDKKKGKKNEGDPIKDLKEKIMESVVPEVKDIEEYVLSLNGLFVSAIEILNTAQGIYNSGAGYDG